MTVRIVPARVGDAEALTDLHLDVWEEAYADLVPASVFTERRARRAERVASWSGVIASGSSDNLLAWSADGRLLGFYERHGFAFDGATKPEDVGIERRMVRR